MQIVMPAACDSFAPVLLLLRQDGFKLGSEKHTTEVTVKKSGSLLINSGIQGYSLLKTTQSGFEGFMRDRYTLLPETRERIVATEVTAWWSR
ncbi:uricase-2 isozyme 1-like isoform X2 [Triticum urartu]|uniref:uricase-2 isozyme 1-like isoform X2 n=1 Tax=Triticum urartu TaxID=4572 RepID=UPI002044990E|nr:uricase-2 isozyme 1-like isoform X2 [Triticum urartu]